MGQSVENKTLDKHADSQSWNGSSGFQHSTSPNAANEPEEGGGDEISCHIHSGGEKSSIDRNRGSVDHFSGVGEEKQNRSDDVFHFGESTQRNLGQHLGRLLSVRSPKLSPHRSHDDGRVDRVHADAVRT